MLSVSEIYFLKKVIILKITFARLCARCPGLPSRLLSAVQVTSGSLAITAIVVLLPSVSSPHWRSPLSALDRWRLGDDALRHSFKTSDVLPSCHFSGWSVAFYSTAGQPSEAVALMAHSSRSFGWWLLPHWLFSAALSVNFSAGGT